MSVYNIKKPTFYQNKSLHLLDGNIYHLYPLKPLQVAADLITAPFLFGRGFFKAIFKAALAKSEGIKERLKVLAHLVPALRLAHHWRKNNVKHVHAQWAHTAATIGMHAAEMLDVGFSFMGHANDLFVHRVALEDKIKRARFILCISEYHRRFYLDLGADPERLHVVYCGISLDRFSDNKSFDANVKKIVSVGRLVEKKGFHILIRACAEMRDRGVDFECTIAGSGPEHDRLNGLIAELNLQDRVVITGEAILQEDIPELLRSARLFSLPCVKDSDGDMDGLPQVLIESMACRVPAVSTFLVGIPDLVRHNENGLVVETENVSACADAMQRLLENDELTEQLGIESEQWAKSHFSRTELANRLEQVFFWATANPGRTAPTSLLPPAPGSKACYDNPSFETGVASDADASHVSPDAVTGDTTEEVPSEVALVS